MRAHFYCVVRTRILGNESAILETAPIEMVVKRPYGEHDGELLFLSSIKRFWTHFKYTKVSLLFNSLILAASELWLWLMHANTCRYGAGAL